MALRAVFFDFDDTLCATSDHDKTAYAACVALLATEFPTLNGQDLVAAYKRRLSKAPWDPEDRTSVADWRSGLWTKAVEDLARTAPVAPAAPAASSDTSAIASASGATAAAAAADAAAKEKDKSDQTTKNDKNDKKKEEQSEEKRENGEEEAEDEAKAAGGASLAASNEAAGEGLVALGRRLHECFDATRLASLAWVGDAVSVVRACHEMGFRTCIITNGHSDVQHPKIEAIKARDLIPEIIVGGDEVKAGRKEKPDPGIFLAACKLLDVEPREAFHVGDSFSSDVKGAYAAGLGGAVWVNASGSNRPPLPEGSTKFWAIRNLSELLGVISEFQSAERLQQGNL